MPDSLEFFAEVDPAERTCESLAAGFPEIPFFTSAYLRARRSTGFQPVVLGLRERSGALASGCAALLKANFLFLSLQIPFLPRLPRPDIFRDGLLGFCRETRIRRLSLTSGAAPGDQPLSLPGEPRCTPRCAYLLDLTGGDLRSRFSPGHVRNIRRAESAGLRLDRTRRPEACKEHVRLASHSMERRRKRGEQVPAVDGAGFPAYLEEGAGELFRVMSGDQVLASVMVLRARRGAYYQSAGNSPEGMASGASHFLVHRTAETLRAEGLTLFNLGGAGADAAGLHRFKAGFGAEKVELETVEWFLGGMLQRTSLAALQSVRTACREVTRGLREAWR
ncbi:MAG TPA: GNAT family N-acetyltransferase [candidate division Zixibacteria bacterium]|nr:GNAT family N-acetyltransferase [candidate division Zixibacteria bacterium]